MSWSSLTRTLRGQVKAAAGLSSATAFQKGGHDTQPTGQCRRICCGALRVAAFSASLSGLRYKQHTRLGVPWRALEGAAGGIHRCDCRSRPLNFEKMSPTEQTSDISPWQIISYRQLLGHGRLATERVWHSRPQDSGARHNEKRKKADNLFDRRRIAPDSSR